MLKNQKKGFFEKVFKEMRLKLKDLIVDVAEVELLEKLEPEGPGVRPKVSVFRGVFLFTRVEVRVTRLGSLDLNELVELTHRKNCTKRSRCSSDCGTRT